MAFPSLVTLAQPPEVGGDFLVLDLITLLLCCCLLSLGLPLAWGAGPTREEEEVFSTACGSADIATGVVK